MELKFNKSVCPYLRRVTSQVQSGEQTQEIRLPEGMPDIGRVIGCWGQVLTRGKEWRSNGMSVNGGVIAWVLYLPEDGTEPRVVDAWLPYQLKWDFPETQRDGSICAHVTLKNMDARSTSARKMMVRSAVSILGTAYEPAQAELYSLDSVPEDVQILKNTYPLELPQEAGEKNFQLDEELTVPENMPAIHKLVHYRLDPQVSDQKVMAGKLVFKGSCGLDLLYLSDDGTLNRWNTQIPFSQYVDLDQDHDAGSQAQIVPMLTGIEMEKDEEGRLRMKCGIAGQYTVFDRTLVDVVEDAYSPRRKVDMSVGTLCLPVRLDSREETVSYTHSVHADAQKNLDLTVLPDQPSCIQTGDRTQIRLPMQYQMLYADAGGSLQGSSGRFEEELSIPSEPGNFSVATLRVSREQAAISGEDVEISSSVTMDIQTFRDEKIPMVTEIQLGELLPGDPLRPSLVLRKIGEQRLWDLAKETGSTVEAIKEANGILQDPPADKFLLIPVY